MTFLNLQDELRAHIRARIRRGELTGSGLARRAGFPQGHLSNFLNARRGLSLESMDRLLDTLGIEVLDLVNAEEIRRRALLGSAREALEPVAMVATQHVALARFAPEQILETRSFSRSFLRRLKAREAATDDRRDWQRFVLIKMDGQIFGELLPWRAQATLLIDRHYSSLEPYRRLRPNVYAVTLGGRCRMGHVSLFDDQLVLRPGDPDQELEAVPIGRGRSYSEYIIGRVCHIALEV